MKAVLVAGYLAAIVAANLTLAEWGPRMAVYNAFVFVGLDLVSRDRLHDLWRGHLIRNMAALIAAGSALSYLAGLAIGTGPFVGRIALASCVAFAAAALADTFAYHLLRHRSWFERANQSNLAGAAVDSAVFVALWPFAWSTDLAFTLFAAKVAGGVVWAFLLGNLRNERYEARRVVGVTGMPLAPAQTAVNDLGVVASSPTGTTVGTGRRRLLFDSHTPDPK